MAHVNRRIGKSSETATSTADGTGGGVLPDSYTITLIDQEML